MPYQLTTQIFQIYIPWSITWTETYLLPILSMDKYKENKSHLQSRYLWAFASAAD